MNQIERKALNIRCKKHFQGWMRLIHEHNGRIHQAAVYDDRHETAEMHSGSLLLRRNPFLNNTPAKTR